MSDTIEFKGNQYLLADVESVGRSGQMVSLYFKDRRGPVHCVCESVGEAADEYLRLFDLIGKSNVSY